MPDRLPLFPLRTVLYPGALLPLHIFEDRYRLLITRLVRQPEDTPREFGVVAIRVGTEVGSDAMPTLYDVGCTARLRQVIAHADGRYDIVTTGTRRFRLRNVDSSRPYLTGEVDWLAEGVTEPAQRLVPLVAAGFQRYRRLLAARIGEAIDRLPDEPVVLSYLVSAAMVLDLSDKQRLLAAPDATARLRLALGLLRREETLIRELGALPAVDLQVLAEKG